MAQMDFTVNPNEVESDGYDLLPQDEYVAIIEESDYKANSNNSGKMLKLTYQIIEGNFKGQKLWENLNLEHPSAQAVEISRKALNSILLAVGIDGLKDSAQLHNIPMTIKVGVKGKETDTYGIQNVIKKHTKYVAGQTVAPIQQAPTPVSVGSETVAKQPWDR